MNDTAPSPNSARSPNPAPPGVSAAPACRPRVLVVDDAGRIRLALRCCLEAYGYEVEEAGDGREALAAVARFRPDLVLMDLAMPVLDGLSAARGVDSAAVGLHPRVIVLTAHGSVAMAAAARACGVSAFLEKPVLPDELHEVVSRVLADGRTAGGNAVAARHCGAD